VSERLRWARKGGKRGAEPPRGGSGAAPPKIFFLGRHIFAGFGPTYYRRADIFPTYFQDHMILGGFRHMVFADGFFYFRLRN
jgi:hypothetical protein